MTPERWKQVEEVLAATLECAPVERSAFLAQACADDDTLRREVEGLVASYEQAGSFIEDPALNSFNFDAPRATDEAPLIGQRIGAYRIVSELGRGGMGAVYLAVRADDEFQKRVAIKLVKRGMDTDFILRRFRQERQILASLDHPYIARLFDGGTTDDGLPYFVMEFIQGLPINRYCDAQHLSTVERLRLFVKVCAPVTYAHHNLVIHRDLKPSNVLVTSDGTPKLLDFGIAKLLNPEMGAQTLDPTTMAMRLMTPEYASPEQVRGEAVTVASDVYSLGVLLYELLTGHRPYRLYARHPEEVARVICEQEPERPSVVINAIEVIPMNGAEPLEITPDSISRVRDGSLDKLRRQLSGSLDNILLKALRKEPPRRYQSVEEFAADIKRYLEGQPVSAPSFYPATAETRVVAAPEATSAGHSIAVLPFKLLRVEKREDEFLGMGMADAIITKLSNIQGIIVRPTSAILKYFDGEHNALIAGHELGVDFVLDGRIQRAGERLRVTVQLVRMRDGAPLWATNFDQEFTDLFTVEDSISEQVTQALTPQLTTDGRERQQLPQTNINESASAPAATAAKDHHLLSAHTSTPPLDHSSASSSAGSHTALMPRPTENEEAYQLYVAARYYATRRTADGLRQAVERLESAVQLDPNFACAYSEMADCYALLNWYVEPPPAGAWERAREAALRAVEADETLADGHASLGFVKLHYERDFASAENEFRRALELKPESAVARRWHANNLSAMGRHDEAVSEIRRAQEIAPRSAVIATAVANILFFARRYNEAIEQCRHALELDSGSVAAHVLMRWAYERQGMHDEALAIFEQERVFAGDTPTTRAKRVHVLAAVGQSEKARALLDELLARREEEWVTAYEIAIIHALLHERDSALSWLERAEREHAVGFTFVLVDPHLDSLRDDPRFEELLRRAGLQVFETSSQVRDSASGSMSGSLEVAPPAQHEAASGSHALAANNDGEANAYAEKAINAREPLHAEQPEQGARRQKHWSKYAIIVGACLALLLLVIAGIWLRQYFESVRAHTVAFQNPKIIKLTTSGNATSAALSPDGKYVAYALNEGGKQGLWVRQVAVANSIRLVAPAETRYLGLTFSHDSVYVYYTASNSDGARALYRVPTLGGSVNKLKDNLDSPIGFSPDGHHYAFVRNDFVLGQDSLLVSDELGNERQIATRKFPEHFSTSSAPAWSPDGRMLACVLEGSDENGFFMKALEVDSASGALKTLSSKRWIEIGQMAWLPESNGLILTAKDENSSFLQLWRLSYPEGAAQGITWDLSDYDGLSLAADAHALVSIQSQTVTSVWSAPRGNFTHPVQITSSAGRYVDLYWTPEGRVLYASDASGNADIWEMEADGTGQRQLTAGAARNYAPITTPDGRYILFHSNRTGAWQIWRMNRDGSDPVQLTNGKENSNWPSVTPDGRFVIYEHTGEGALANLWKVPLEGGTPVRLTDTLSQRPAVSPDGKLVAYWQKDNEPGALWRLAIISLAGGPPLYRFDVPQSPADGNSNIRWTEDNRAVIYTDFRNNVTNLRLQYLDGSEPKQLTDFTKEQFYSFDLAHDGRLLLAQGFTTEDVILITDATAK